MESFPAYFHPPAIPPPEALSQKLFFLTKDACNGGIIPKFIYQKTSSFQTSLTGILFCNRIQSCYLSLPERCQAKLKLTFSQGMSYDGN
jgi:hypothetical protein